MHRICCRNILFILVLVHFFYLLFACSSHSNQEFTSSTVYIDVNFEEKCQDELKLSDCVEDVQFVPVSGAEAFKPQGPIARYCRGFFYVQDSEACQVVKISEDGNIVGKFGSQGRASNEYLSITSFDVNPSTSEVYVYDGARNMMVIYSDDGSYVRSFSLDDTKGLFRDFAVFRNGNIIGCDFLTTSDSFFERDFVRNGVWIVDSNGHFLKQIVSEDKHTRYSIGISLPLFSRIDDETVCVMGPVGDDSIYKIDSDGNVVMRYLFDFGTQISRRDLRREASVSVPDYFYIKTAFSIYPSFINIWLSKGDDCYELTYNLTEGKCTVIPSRTEMIKRDVPNYCGGAITGGCRSLNFCDAEHLPSDIPNPDSTALWMVVTHLK